MSIKPYIHSFNKTNLEVDLTNMESLTLTLQISDSNVRKFLWSFIKLLF